MCYVLRVVCFRLCVLVVHVIGYELCVTGCVTGYVLCRTQENTATPHHYNLFCNGFKMEKTITPITAGAPASQVH